jgi:hypothetical protein
MSAKTKAAAKTGPVKVGRVIVHIGGRFSMVCFPDVKWNRKRIPAEWRN